MTMSLVDRARDAILRKASFYRALFSQDRLDAREVLKDLARFCRAYETTFDADPRLHAVLEGRREVWLRIQKYAHLSESDVLGIRSSIVADERSGSRFGE